MSDEKKPDHQNETKESEPRKAAPAPSKPEPKRRQRGEFEGWEKGEEDLT